MEPDRTREESAHLDAPAPPRLSPEAAAFAGWMLPAVANAALMMTLPRAHLPLRVRLTHHGYEALRLAAAGLLAAALTAAWVRWPKRRAETGHLAIFLSAFGVGALVLPPDVAGTLQDLGAKSSQSPAAYALIALVALTIPASRALGSAVAARGKGLWGAGFALLIAALNVAVLRGDYRGVHLFLGWMSATLAGASLAGSPLPNVALQLRKAKIPAALLLALASIAAIVVPPNNLVRVEMQRTHGAVLAPLLVRIPRFEELRAIHVPPAMEPWFRDRSGAPPVPPGPSMVPKDAIIVLITIDSARADLLTNPRYREKIPKIAALFDASVSFSNARSPGSFTRTSLGMMFTGKYISQLRWGRFAGNRGWLDEDTSDRFPELLAKAGVKTVTFASYKDLVNKVGIARGFTEEAALEPPPEQRFALADAMMSAAIERLEAHKEGPLFLFLHLMDAHYPYDADGPVGPPFERYLREITLCDTAVGRLVDALQKRGLWDRSVLIVGSDHGEAFGQHDTTYHGQTLYEELLRIPLAIRVPGAAPRVVDTPVSLIDVGPTVLDLAGLPTPGAFMGQSLLPLVRGEPAALGRPIIAEFWTKQALVVGARKVILDETGTVEVYDLGKDPNETMNLADYLGSSAVEVDWLKGFFATHGKTWDDPRDEADKKKKKKKKKRPKHHEQMKPKPSEDL